MKRRFREDFKTMHNVFDEFTNRTIFKLISEGYISGLESPISIGKEANIFSAKRKDGSRVIVKIYRLEACDFNRMYDYIKEDPRYGGIKGKKRKVIFAWVQREYRNLLIAREANVSVPTPLTFKNNVLVLEFIGKADKVAPKLGVEPPKNQKEFFNKVIDNMKKLYKAGLVHADLFPSNCSRQLKDRRIHQERCKKCLQFLQKVGFKSRWRENFKKDSKNLNISNKISHAL